MTAGKNITLKNSNSFLKALCLPSSTNAQATEAQKKLYPFLMFWQNPFCLGQKHLGINHSWLWGLMATCSPDFWAGSALSSWCISVPQQPWGSHTYWGGVPSVLGTPRGGGRRGCPRHALLRGAGAVEATGQGFGLAVSQLCCWFGWGIYPGSSLPSGLSFPSSVRWNPFVSRMLRLDLGDFPNIYLNRAKAFLSQKTSILLCGRNDDVRAEYLGSPNSLLQNRNQLIRGTDRLITAQRALLFIPKDLVNQQ